MKTQGINRIIFILSILGVLMAIYVLQSFLRQSPIVCISTGCETVRKNTAAWPFGIPVPAFGLVGYSVLAACAFLKTAKVNAKLLKLINGIMLGMAAFGVLFVSWFTYTELFVIRGICMWCAISAVNMVIVFGLIMFERSRERKSTA